MPVTIKKSQLMYKNPSTGEYVSVDAVADKTSQQQINGINTAASNAIASINTAMQDIDTQPLTTLPKKAYKKDLVANEETLASAATHAYAVGDYFFVADNNNDISLYKATAAIAVGATISPGTGIDNNCVPAALADDVTSLSNDIGTVKADLSEIDTRNKTISGSTIDIYDCFETGTPVALELTDPTANVAVSGNMFSAIAESTKISQGVTVSSDGKGKLTISGTARAYSMNIFALPESFTVQAGMSFHFKNTGIVSGAMAFYTPEGAGITGGSISFSVVDRIYTVPPTFTELVGKTVGRIGISINSGQSVDMTIEPMLLWTAEKMEYTEYYPEETYASGQSLTLRKGYNHIRASIGDVSITYKGLANFATVEEVQEMIDSHIPDNSIIERNTDIIPILNGASVYGHNGNGLANIDRLYTLLAVTDTHGDYIRTGSAIKYSNSMPQIKAMIHLGDIVGANFSSPYAWFREAVQESNKPFYICLGNHDGGDVAVDTTNGATVQQQFDRFILPNLDKIGINNLTVPWYSINDDHYKITLIVLDCYDLPDTLVDGAFVVRRNTPGYSQAQIDWLVATLANVPDDHHVLIAQHCLFETVTPDNNEWRNPQYSYVCSPSVVAIYDYKGMLMEIIEAWKEGTTLNKTYTASTQGMPNLTVDADFTSRETGVFVGYLIGHTHYDQTGVVTAFPTQHYYNLDTTANDYYQNKWSDLPRQLGTKCEDCITTLSIDTTNRRVKMVRVGSNQTFNLTPRQKVMINY